MSRRSNPENVYQAHRVGTFARLTQNEHVDELEAEHLIARWERHAEAEGLSSTAVGFRATAWDWISEQRRAT